MFQNLIKAVGILLTASINLSIAQGDINKEPVLEIPKINLAQTIYPNDKTLNTVEKNIQVIEGSKMPDVKKGNLILAAHSGNSNVGYFKNLDKLKIKDNLYINYQGIKYEYIIEKIYDVEKTGFVGIKRDDKKNTITLITCKKNTNKQTVYIGYISKVLKTP